MRFTKDTSDMSEEIAKLTLKQTSGGMSDEKAKRSSISLEKRHNVPQPHHILRSCPSKNVINFVKNIGHLKYLWEKLRRYVFRHISMS
jgi:hypothetical protein